MFDLRDRAAVALAQDADGRVLVRRSELERQAECERVLLVLRRLPDDLQPRAALRLGRGPAWSRSGSRRSASTTRRSSARRRRRRPCSEPEPARSCSTASPGRSRRWPPRPGPTRRTAPISCRPCPHLHEPPALRLVGSPGASRSGSRRWHSTTRRSSARRRRRRPCSEPEPARSRSTRPPGTSARERTRPDRSSRTGAITCGPDPPAWRLRRRLVRPVQVHGVRRSTTRRSSA